MSRGCPGRQYEECTSRLPLRLACRRPVINNMTLTCTFCVPPATSCSGGAEGASGMPYGPALSHTANTQSAELNSAERLPAPLCANQGSALFNQFSSAVLDKPPGSPFSTRHCLINVNTRTDSDATVTWSQRPRLPRLQGMFCEMGMEKDIRCFINDGILFDSFGELF